MTDSSHRPAEKAHIGDRTQWFMAEAWEECAKDAHALGWLHDWALSDLLARNPYQVSSPPSASEGQPTCDLPLGDGYTCDLPEGHDV